MSSKLDYTEVERAARHAYGTLLARLTRATNGDIAAAEDALSGALESALAKWPLEGAPRHPEAWLLTVARRRVLDEYRKADVRRRAVQTLVTMHEHRIDADVEPRLPLMFVCAHPAIDVHVRTPLILQVVLGMTAAQIAQAFLVSPSSMAKRLVRAKAKIKEAGIRFDVPAAHQWSSRLGAVLDAIYAAYGRSWDFTLAVDADVLSLAREATFLAHILARALPDEPEACALVALMAYCDARIEARTDVHGESVALDDQDTSLWHRGKIALAEASLKHASTHASPGRYQLEAAIQSCHIARRLHGVDNTAELEALYEVLITHTRGLGARLGYIAAVSRHRGPQIASDLLDAMDPDEVAAFQPFWALRAEVYAACHRMRQASEAYERAIGLTRSPQGRRMLQSRRARHAKT